MPGTNRKNGTKDSILLSYRLSRLPPLKAVRAFEAAARHGGFHAAAEELNVSANAVGAHVRTLEQWLGVELFSRVGRGVHLTDAGRYYGDELGPLLSQLAEVTSRVRRLTGPPALTISAMPSFAANWLIPRLGSLSEACPGLDIRVVANVSATDFESEDVDLAIRLGPGTYPGMQSDVLVAEQFFPVCSPTLLKGPVPLRTLSDLSRHVLLHDEFEPRIPEQMNWPRWLAAVGAPDLAAKRAAKFSYSHMSLQAAAEGHGIALASSVLAQNQLASGALVRPFPDLSVAGPYGFHIVCPRETAGLSKILGFKIWALREASKSA